MGAQDGTIVAQSGVGSEDQNDAGNAETADDATG
jgi:hypothetical protein